MPVWRLEPGDVGTPEPFPGLIDFAHQTVMVRNAFLDDLVAHAYGVDRVNGRVEVRLLSGQEFVILPPELGYDVFEAAVLGDLRGAPLSAPLSWSMQIFEGGQVVALQHIRAGRDRVGPGKFAEQLD